MAQMVDITAVRSDWQSRGFSCDVWIDPPGRVWEDYRHAVDEVVMVLEGEAEFDIAGKVIRPAPGEEVLIPSGAVHTVRNLGTATSRWLYGYKSTEG
jgi:mannose-6-phosphate isomerase-like protein (cupin superfamily)